MPERADGSFYPAAGDRTPNRKEAKRLEARIKSWENLPISLKGKQYGYTKPGSNRK